MNLLRLVSVATLLVLAGLPAVGGSDSNASVPPLDRPWLAADCQRFSKLVREKAVSLPLLKEEPGGAQLRHFCDLRNLAPLRDKATPVLVRMKDCFSMNLAVGGLLKFYGDKAKSGELHEDESTLLSVHLLEVLTLGAELTDEAMATFPEAVRGPIRSKAAELARSSASQQFLALAFSAASQGRSPDNQTRLLEGLAAVAPRISRILKPNVSEVRVPLEQLRERSSGRDRQAIDGIFNQREMWSK